MSLKAVWQARSSAEFDAAFVRIGWISMLALIGLADSPLGIPHSDVTVPWPEDQRVFAIGMVGWLVLAAGIFAAIWRSPAPSTSRRILGVFTDAAAVTFYLLFQGSSGAVLIGVYLLFIFANGFRFGRMYLHISQCFSLLGLALLLSRAEWWQYQWYEKNALLFGWILTLILVPLYVSVLLGGLQRSSRVAR